MATDKHTPTPWVVQELNHVDGDLWLQIGLPSGWGPIAGIEGDEVREPAFKPVAGMKYLVTSEHEQRANAAFIVRCVNAHDALVSALRDAVEALCRVDCGCCEEPTHGHSSVCKNARAALAEGEDAG